MCSSFQNCTDGCVEKINSQIADAFDTAYATVSTWRNRFYNSTSGYCAVCFSLQCAEISYVCRNCTIEKPLLAQFHGKTRRSRNFKKLNRSAPFTWNPPQPAEADMEVYSTDEMTEVQARERKYTDKPITDIIPDIFRVDFQGIP